MDMARTGLEESLNENAFMEPSTLSQTVNGRERIYCPTGCGSELQGRSCKLWCPKCGPVISCSDM